MEYRELGSTGIRISAVAFGAGPVAALMTADNEVRQRDTVRAALDAGINWFDTAATYGDGRSELSLGETLDNLGARDDVHIATKVRLAPAELDDIGVSVRRSVVASLQRLGVARISLLQLHNSITGSRGDEHTSMTPNDVLRPGGVLEVFRTLQDELLVDHIGLTAIGQPDALREVIHSGQFATVQVPYNVLDPSAGQPGASGSGERDLGDLIADCVGQKMGVLVIRVFAGGALAGQPPSEHALQTKFFPLELYRRDQCRCAQLRKALGCDMDLKEAALRFVLSHPGVSSAIIGFGAPGHVENLVTYLEAGPLPPEILEVVLQAYPG